MTENEILPVLQVLFGGYPGKEITGFTTQAYHAALSEYTQKTALDAVKELLRKPTRFPPTAGEIAEVCQRMQRRKMFEEPKAVTPEKDLTPEQAREVIRRTYAARPEVKQVLGLGEVLETEKKEKVA